MGIPLFRILEESYTVIPENWYTVLTEVRYTARTVIPYGTVRFQNSSNISYKNGKPLKKTISKHHNWGA